jgi:hypothetical protein
MTAMIRRYRVLTEPDRPLPWIVFGEDLDDRRAAWVEMRRFPTEEHANSWIAEVQQRQRELTQ